MAGSSAPEQNARSNVKSKISSRTQRDVRSFFQLKDLYARIPENAVQLELSSQFDICILFSSDTYPLQNRWHFLKLHASTALLMFHNYIGFFSRLAMYLGCCHSLGKAGCRPVFCFQITSRHLCVYQEHAMQVRPHLPNSIICLVAVFTVSSSGVNPALPNLFNNSAAPSFATVVISRPWSARLSMNFLSGYSRRKIASKLFHE